MIGDRRVAEPEKVGGNLARNNLRVETVGLHSVGGEKVEGRARWPVKRQM